MQKGIDMINTHEVACIGFVYFYVLYCSSYSKSEKTIFSECDCKGYVLYSII